MSDWADRLTPKIEQAVNDHLAADDGSGGFVTSFFLVAQTVNDDGTGWIYACAEQQTVQQSMGLIKWAEGVMHYEQMRYLDDVTDD